MVQYLCLFSLILQDLHEEGESGSWNSGPERSKYEGPILRNNKILEDLQSIILEYRKILGE